jgi:biotin synthase-like enzyme
VRDPALEGRVRRHVRKVLPCGNFEQEGVSKEVYHYGLDAAMLEARLRSLPAPDLVGIGSIFTWHGDPVRETVEVCRKVFPSARVVIGGNFATLCPDEAATLGADDVFVGDVDAAVWQPTAIDLIGSDRSADFVRMVKGCPNKCSYCVTNVLNGNHVLTRPVDDVLAEIEAKIRANGTRTFIFYDDYVLYKQSRFIDPLLDRVAAAGLGIQIEFALGFAAQQVKEPFAERLRKAGVERVILALETIRASESKEMHRPHHIGEFVRAVEILKGQGFSGRNLRAFYLIGLPGQTLDEILRAILFLYSLGVTPSLTTYTLTPRSGDMVRFGHLAQGLALDELAPCLWRFAHPGMTVRGLDAVYRYFHERYFPLAKIRASRTDDPVIVAMQEILRTNRHLPENW